MKKGDRVRIVSGPWANDCGTVHKVTKAMLKVKLDTSHRGLALIHPSDAQLVDTATDFDKGFGIGGLARYGEKPIVPTAAQIERAVQAERQAKVCRSCGQSTLSGAMFTTGGGGNVCDDCF